ncbi:MAG: helix-turn-helix domain-containing protein [Alphaproteobacteria bacterium]
MISLSATASRTVAAAVAPRAASGAHLSAVSEKVLTAQLRELEADGLVHRQVHSGPPAKVVYSLTELGAGLNDGATALCKWGAALKVR